MILLALKEIEQAYEAMYQSIELLQNEYKFSFYEGYVLQLELMLDDEKIDEQRLSETGREQLNQYLATLKAISLSAEEKRKVSQLVLLKGATIDPLQANHQLTPDSIGFLIVYLLEQLSTKKELRLLDPAVGFGNLLATALLNLTIAGRKTTGIGVDIDDLLLQIAALNADWFEMPLHLFHQDGTQPLLADLVDFVISDLPIGYYPLDEHAQEFLTRASDGHSYAHHLLMEASMRQLTDDGFGIFLVPSNLLMSEQAPELKKWLNEKVYLQALLQLPASMFKSENSRKDILILQNRNAQTVPAKETLLAELPSLKDMQGLQRFFSQFAKWKEEKLVK